MLPPRSPKLNGCVKQAQRTHTDQFYEGTEFSLEVVTLNQELQAWERTYNTTRLHQALRPYPSVIYHPVATPNKGPKVSLIYLTSTRGLTSPRDTIRMHPVVGDSNP